MNESVFGLRLLSSFMLRFYMSVILSGTAALGVFWSWMFLSFGVTSMPIRYALTTLACYACFFGLMRLWLAWVSGQMHDVDVIDGAVSSIDTDDLGDAIEVAADSVHVSSMRLGSSASSVSDGPGLSASSDHDVSGDVDFGDADSDGFVLVGLLLLLVCVAFGAGVYLIWLAPNILTDAAFQFALAAGLVKPVKKMEEHCWMESTFAVTRTPFAIILVIAVLVGVLCQVFFPGSVRMADVLARF